MTELPISLQKQLKECRTLPSIPVVILEVLDLCQNDEVGIPEVTKVLIRDPALSAKVLKVANSPLYGVRSRITTLDRAISLLGINATLSLALSFSFVRSLHRSSEGGFNHQAYWRRSVIAAVAARTIGLRLSKLNPEELFLAGLLQDLGMLVFNEAVPAQYGPVVNAAKWDHAALVAHERETFGADHSDVGCWLLARWNLPERLREAVAGSHDPRGIGEMSPDSLVNCIAFASRIAEIWCNPDTNAAAALARQGSESILQVPPEQFDRLLGEIAFSIAEATANLDIDVGSEESLNRILDQAREALVLLGLQAQQAARDLQQKAQIDRLTSLNNRAYLDIVLPQFFESAQHLGQPLSVLFMDLDDFKIINDSYGHQAGDGVLISVARILRAGVRTPDTIIRYGGDEFVGLLPNTNEKDASLVAERLRVAIGSQEYHVAEGVKIRMTVSVGCATISPRHRFVTPQELLSAADTCLYAAKKAGRNRVVTLEPLTS
jgi:diguanylate cyclase (GGDEF)-like protein